MDQRIQFVIVAMKENPHRSVEDLARLVDLSVSRFHHLFKAETDKTPTYYLRTLRLNFARELIQTSRLSMKQVLNTVGVKDRSHFYREFKRIFGLTPTQWRRAALYDPTLNRKRAAR